MTKTFDIGRTSRFSRIFFKSRTVSVFCICSCVPVCFFAFIYWLFIMFRGAYATSDCFSTSEYLLYFHLLQVQNPFIHIYRTCPQDSFFCTLLIHRLPLRLHCVGGCWDRSQGSCYALTAWLDLCGFLSAVMTYY
jgi:hypothetical protein